MDEASLRVRLQARLARPGRRLLALARAHWVALPIAALVLYFGYHALHGRFGLFAWFDLTSEIALASHELGLLRGEREDLERRVALLQLDSSDPDLLEEEIRRALGYVRDDEVIILLPPEE